MSSENITNWISNGTPQSGKPVFCWCY